MAQRARLRASDADREHVAEQLRNATAEGRLLAEELEQRLGSAFRARTYAELDALVADIPRGQVATRRSRGLHPWVVPAVGVAIAIPVMMAVIVAVVFVLTGVFAMWMVWVAVGWWFFGRRRACAARSMRGGDRRPGLYGPRPHPRPGSWL